MENSIFELEAELCKRMGSAPRLEILHLLCKGPQRVRDIVAETGLTRSHVSRDLSILGTGGLVAKRRRGIDTVYIASPAIMRLCELMRQALVEQAAERSIIVDALSKMERVGNQGIRRA